VAAAELAELLVPALAVGATPEQALRAAVDALPESRRVEPAFAQLAASLGRGEPATTALQAAAGAPGGAALRSLARGFGLSDALGAPLAPAVSAQALMLRQRHADAERAATAAAGPRATMRLLALLPLAGPAVGLVFGISPASLYAGSVPATASLAVGLGLAGAGWWWSRALVERATRPERVG
jgi:tight adherence protein B